MTKQIYTPVRFSHLTTYAGVGSIVRSSSNQLMIIPDTRYWIASEPIHSINGAKNRLKIGDIDLRQPLQVKLSEKTGQPDAECIPAILFPKYAVCSNPDCRILHHNPWNKENISERKECPKCRKGSFKQVTWCFASENGYIAEVPWHYFCHKNNNQNHCLHEFSDELYLKLTSDGRKTQVHCTKCGAKGDFLRQKGPFQNKKMHPWLDKPVDGEHIEGQVLEVNSPNLYFSSFVSALIIPPESRCAGDSLSPYRGLWREIQEEDEEMRKEFLKAQLADRLNCDKAELDERFAAIQSREEQFRPLNDGAIWEAEFEALSKPLDFQEGEDFVTFSKTENFNSLNKDVDKNSTKFKCIHFVEELIQIARLREIRVFKGFRRIKTTETNLIPPDLDKTVGWLPAIDLYGEGIFFTIKDELLRDWESGIDIKYKDELKSRYEKSEVHLEDLVTISARFVLLHTMSHLLMRELESRAGYPAASLKERIYCSAQDKMAGILIYTAVPDIVGTLGGIVESAEPKAFLALISNAIESARWCSFDPVCRKHEGRGLGGLNNAACHACCLAPETSCSFHNTILDRKFVNSFIDSIQVEN